MATVNKVEPPENSPQVFNEALEKAVCASPEDDLTRLVYADWLEENGESERAEFIRMQVELAKVEEDSCVSCWNSERGGPCCTGRAALQQRERELWRTHGRDWFGQPGGDDRSNSDHLYFVRPTAHRFTTYDIRRGFVAEVRCTLADWIGGGCERCVFGIYTDDEMVCTRCNGTGRTPGIGPQVVAAHPVEFVGVTDREPHPQNPAVGDKWGWAAGVVSSSASYLPAELFATLGGSTQGFMWFAARELARAALSAALITWAKKRYC